MGLLSLSGTGIATCDPDIARISVAITTSAKSSRDTRKAYNVLANKLVEKGQSKFNIQLKDIEHNAPQIYPEYDRTKKRQDETSQSRIIGYHSRGQVSFKLRNLDDVDNFVDVCSDLGNEVAIGSVSFDVDDKTALYNSARVAAVKDVRQKAELYCREADVTLGSLETLSEDSYGGGVRVVAKAALRMEGMACDDDGTHVQAAETSITLNVQVEWNILPRPTEHHDEQQFESQRLVVKEK